VLKQDESQLKSNGNKFPIQTTIEFIAGKPHKVTTKEATRLVTSIAIIITLTITITDGTNHITFKASRGVKMPTMSNTTI